MPPAWVLVLFSQLCFVACMSGQRKWWHWLKVCFQGGFSRVWKSGVRKWRSLWAVSPVEALGDQRTKPGQEGRVLGMRRLSLNLRKQYLEFSDFRSGLIPEESRPEWDLGRERKWGRRSNRGKGHWRRSGKGIRRLSLWCCMCCPSGSWDQRCGHELVVKQNLECGPWCSLMWGAWGVYISGL